MLACAGTSNALEGTVETKTTSVSLTFDGLEPYGIPSHRGLTTINYDKDRGYLYLYNKANNGGTFYIGKNGTVGENPVTQRSSDETLKNNARNDLFYCEAGKTYRLKYDYKYLAGSGGVGRTMSIWLLPDPLAASISDYDLAKRATLIFYEAPHKLAAALRDMADTFGDRNIALVKELTKLHESVERTTLFSAAAKYADGSAKGEYVIIIEGEAEKTESSEMPLFDAVAAAKELMDGGMPASAAAKEAAALSGRKKNEIYKELVKQQ